MYNFKQILDQTEGKHLVCVLGPTASGKTKFAVRLAAAMDAEIISADSRQVYRGMDIGTGKDLADYTFVNGDGVPVKVPYHLIDIAEAGEKYDIFRYQRDFAAAYRDIVSRGKRVILCGGSGLYIEAALRGYSLPEVPPNPQLRAELEQETDEVLISRLASLKKLHNTTDYDTRKRLIRALEIAIYQSEHPDEEVYQEGERINFDPDQILYLGVHVSREERIRRIDLRLEARLKEGLVQEVQHLLDQGIPAEDLLYYGLEYKFLTLYLTGQLPYGEMVNGLRTAIHQFAKRQMTWFRGMERRGIRIVWIDPQPEVWMIYPAYTRHCADVAYSWFQQEGERLGLRVRILYFEDFRADLPFGFDGVEKWPDAVLIRGYDRAVSQFFEQKGITVPNNARAMFCSRDKWQTIQVLGQAGLPVPETICGPSGWEKAHQQLGLPFVVKTRTGSKGEGVFLVEKQEEFQELMFRLRQFPFISGIPCELDDANYLCQKFIAHSRGRDLRVWVLGGQAVAAVVRSNADSFRSNFAQGGQAELFDLTTPSGRQAARLAIRATEAVGLFFAGVDLLFMPDGGWTICEVNGNAGFRTISSVAEFNMPRKVMEALEALMTGALHKEMKD